MTLGMQMRLWYRNASQTARVTTVTVLGAVAALLVASIAIAPSSHGGQVRSLAAGAAGTTAAPGSSAATNPDAVQSNVASGSADTGAGLGGTSAAGAIGSGSTDSTPGAVSGGPVTTPSLPLSASDRGVSASEIKIGFLTANVAGLSGAGFALNIRDDAGQYAQALADYVNRAGGVQGRKITVAVRKTDPTSQSDQAAACRAMVSDYKVFGVVDVGSLSDTPAFDCVATQNQTPFVHNTIWSTQWLARSGGMEVGYPAAIDRISKTWAHDLAGMGWLDGHPTIGIVGDKCIATAPAIQASLEPAFLAAGAGKIVVAEHDCDVQSIASQPPSFVTQFRAAGVTKVLLVCNYVSATVFMKAAQTQLWHPQYSVSDWWQLSEDTSAKNYDPDQFDGAIAITSNGLLLPQSGKQPYGNWQRCSQVATQAGLAPLAFDSKNAELWGMCDNFFLMVDGLKGAGRNPTRMSWAQAIQHLGPETSIAYGPADFRPGKVTGSDQVFTARWDRTCTCYKAISNSRPAFA